MAAAASPACVADIHALGAGFIPYPVNRAGLSIAHDLRTFSSLRKTFARIRPDLVMAYTIKPVIWAGCAARLAGVSQFYALIEGLGYSFQTGGWQRRLLGIITGTLYFFALRRAVKVIFLNPDNKSTFLSKRLIRKSQAEEIDGIGVNLNYFANTPMPLGQPRFLCIARLLGDKGLREYAAAAKCVRARHPDVRVTLVGPADSSPNCIPIDEVRSWHNRGILEYLGEAADVRSSIAESSVYVLPSYHEGMPRTILEAMSMGRPIITTDVPGCRQTVAPGENGFLVPKMQIDALVERMMWFLEHPERCQTMGAASRRMAEERFDVVKINARLMRLLNLNIPGESV